MNRDFKNKLSVLFIFASFLFFNASYAATPSEVGIIVLHGKGGSPNFPVLQKFESKMLDKGYAVVIPRFPWGGKKGKADYSGNLKDAFEIISSEITKLKQDGRKIIVLAGHSMGTPGAVAYAINHTDVDALIGMAPGHFVGSNFHNDFTSFEVNKAKQMVADGQGNETLNIEDYNSGNRRFKMTVKAEDYLSFFDPNGPMNLGVNLEKIGTTPFLWVAPNGDPVTQKGQAKEYFSKAPSNEKSKFVKIEAEHKNAPIKGVKVIHQWISDL